VEYSRITNVFRVLIYVVEADICTASQEIHCLLQNRQFCYRVKHCPENKLSPNSDDSSTPI